MSRTLRRRNPTPLIAALAMALGGQAAPNGQELPPLVVEAVSESATGSGIRAGDRLLTYGGRPLASPAAFQAAVENTVGTASVAIAVQRGDETVIVTVPTGALGIDVRPELPPGALAHYEDGAAALRAGKTDQAIASWSSAARAARAAGQAAAAAWLHGRVGDLLEGQQHWARARAEHTLAWELLETGSDTAAQSRSLVALGRCSRRASDLDAARQWYARAETLDTQAGHEVWAADDLHMLGALGIDRGDLKTAESAYQRSLTIRERLMPDSLAVAHSLHSLATIATMRADLERAKALLSRALEIRERLAPGSREVGDSLHLLGNVAFSRGDLPAAHEYYARALTIFERLAPDSTRVAGSLTNLGNVAIERFEVDSARDYYMRALKIYERAEPDSMSVSTALNNLGWTAQRRGDLVIAQSYYDRALAIRERLAPGSLGVAQVLNTLGSLARARGNLAAAQDYHSRALAIRRRLTAADSILVAHSLHNLGNVLRDRGDLDTALDHLTRASAIYAKRSPDSLYLAGSFYNLGTVALLQGNVTAAHDYHSRGLELREKIAPGSVAVAYSLAGLGSVLARTSRFADALPFFTRAVEIIEDERWQRRSIDARSVLIAQHSQAYTGLLQTHLGLGDVAAAFHTAERMRARSLLEILAEARADIRRGVDERLLERERGLQQQLNASATREARLRAERSDEATVVRKEIEGLLLQYLELQAEIRRASPGYAALMQPQPLRASEVQQRLLDPDTVLLQYALGEDASHLFIVTANTLRSVALPPRARIEKAARRVYELLTARHAIAGESPGQRRLRISNADAAYAEAAGELSAMIVAPAGDVAGKRLLIVADGALQYVPFAALPSNGQPLIVNHEIVNLPSASVLAALRLDRDRPSYQKTVAVFADPVFDAADPRLARARRTDSATAAADVAQLPEEVRASVREAGLLDDRGALTRLPFTREEADAILALAPSGEGTKAIDFSASRSTATSGRVKGHRIVHLATHGIVDTAHPELSGIVLSLVDERGAPQDGFLRLHEVYNLDWNADLVVLSACQTALGQEIKGEGLVGLTRGFMYGGARGVVASLWNVNDSATVDLMKRFYEGLLARGLTPAPALRAAQLEMWKRRQWQAPYYWAAFTLQGDWR